MQMGFVDLVHFIEILAIKTKSLCIVELIKLVILMKTIIQMLHFVGIIIILLLVIINKKHVLIQYLHM